MRRTLRQRILIYLVLLHLVLAAVSVVVLIERPALLLLFEGLFVVSAVIGFLLMRAFFVPRELIRTGAELMRERDFTTHFREVGQSEMDELVSIYNHMVDRLREERLKLEERNLFVDKVLRASPSAVTILDHDGRIADLNKSAEALFEAPARDLLGRTPAEIGSAIGATLSSLAVDESEVVSVAGRRLKCRRAEFYDRGASRTFFVVDELTEELRVSEKAAYGKVIRMMSHEVHNSVGAVRSLLESCGAYSEQLAEEDRRDYEQALTVAVARLLHLNSFMNGLASDVRVPPPEWRPCDMSALLRDLVTLLRPELDRRRIRLRLDDDAALDGIALDKNQIEQVLVNVLRNAMEAVGEDASRGAPWSLNGLRRTVV